MNEKSKDISGGIFFLAVGIAICYGAWKLGLGSPLRPRAGLMPFLTGVVISGLSLTHILFNFKKPRTFQARNSIGSGTRNIGLTILAMLTCIPLMDILGFTIALALFLFFMLKFIDPMKLSTSVLISVITSASLYVGFGLILKVSFPKGILGF
jgi:hypothetical protein